MAIGCGQDDDSGGASTVNDAAGGASESGSSGSSDSPGIDDITGFQPANVTRISGSGSSVEGPFTLGEGMLITAARSGGGNFAVSIVQDEAKEFTFNEIGRYSGRLALRIHDDPTFSGDVAPGEVFFDMLATCCDWEIEFSQDTSEAPLALPPDASGSGDVVIGSVDLKAGADQISGSEDVQTFFAVHLWEIQGLAFQSTNSAGTLDLSDEFGIRPSNARTYILAVEHGSPGTRPLGEWEIAIR